MRFQLVSLMLCLHPLFGGSCLCWAVSAAGTATECTAVLGLVQQAAQLPFQESQEYWREDRNCHGSVLLCLWVPRGPAHHLNLPNPYISIMQHITFPYVLVNLKPFLYLNHSISLSGSVAATKFSVLFSLMHKSFFPLRLN